MDWFKAQIKKTLEIVIEKKVEKATVEMAQEELVLTDKLYSTIKLVNNTLTVVLGSGRVLTKTDATKEDYEAAKNCKSLYELQYVLSCPEIAEDELIKEAEIAKIKAFNEGIKILYKLDDFSFDNSSVYFKGIKRSLPELLIKKFAEIAGIAV